VPNNGEREKGALCAQQHIVDVAVAVVAHLLSCNQQQQQTTALSLSHSFPLPLIFFFCDEGKIFNWVAHFS